MITSLAISTCCCFSYSVRRYQWNQLWSLMEVSFGEVDSFFFPPGHKLVMTGAMTLGCTKGKLHHKLRSQWATSASGIIPRWNFFCHGPWALQIVDVFNIRPPNPRWTGQHSTGVSGCLWLGVGRAMNLFFCWPLDPYSITVTPTWIESTFGSDIGKKHTFPIQIRRTRS